MSTEWSYAQLSKMASSVGGPQELMEIVKNRAFQEGLRKGKNQIILCTAAALGIGILGTTVFNKWNESRKLKVYDQYISADKALTAEKLLIQKVKDVQNDVEEQVDEDTDQSESG